MEKDGGIQVTLFKNEGGQIGGQIEGLSERQAEVLQRIINNTKISRRELAEQLEINELAVQKHLKALTQQGAIERVGTRNGYWKVLIKTK